MKQSTALQILKAGHNVFLTGQAGAGKSYTLNKFIEYLHDSGKTVGVTASSGIAATILSGSTIHSYACLGIKQTITATDISAIRRKAPIANRIKNLDVLILDEISMLHMTQLNMVNYVFKSIRQDFSPFGGVQVVLAGDFFQLPPVGNAPTAERFAFMSRSWAEASFKVCYLTEQYRQGGDELTDILNAIRNNTITEEHEGILLATEHNSLGDSATRLFTHNADVDYLNQAELQKLPGPSKTFTATTTGSPANVKFLMGNVLSPPILHLRVGAKVMFTRNHTEGSYVNGTLGTVSKLGPGNMVFVRLLDDSVIDVDHQVWEKHDDFGEIVATYTQIPLRLAWAITVHKCVTPDTYTHTDQGILQIKDIRSRGLISTSKGFRVYNNKVVNSIVDIARIRTDLNYSINVSFDHNCLTYEGITQKYVEAKSLLRGDWLILKLEDFPTDLVEIPLLSSEIPFNVVTPLLQKSDSLTQLSFIKDMFSHGTLSDPSSIESQFRSLDVCKYVQIVLLQFGIVCGIKEQDGKYFLSLRDLYCSRLCTLLGFDVQPEVKDDVGYVPITREELKELLELGIINQLVFNLYKDLQHLPRKFLPKGHILLNTYSVKVIDITYSKSETMCITVPDTGDFIQNGFIMSNCQGLTLDSAEIDLTSTFECGQGYVALSRLRSIEGLRLLGMNSLSLKLDPLARRADTRFRELSDQLAREYGEE